MFGQSTAAAAFVVAGLVKVGRSFLARKASGNGAAVDPLGRPQGEVPAARPAPSGRTSAAGKGQGPTTWANPETLSDHFLRHGGDFRARSAAEYAQMSSNFLRQSQIQGFPTKIAPNGTIRVYDLRTNTFGSYTHSGATKTFYKPNPAVHKYPTNLAYWNHQVGVSPWTP